MRVYPCGRRDSSECVSASTVGKLRVVLAKAKKTIVPSNYANPYKITVRMDEITIDPLRLKFPQYEVKITKIVDLRNEIFGEEDKGQFVSASLIFQDSVPRFRPVTSCPHAQGAAFTRSCSGYISLIYRGGSEVILVKRQYNSPFQIIGEIGGVLKVTLMLSMAYAFYLQMKKRSFVIESVFSRKKRKGEHYRAAKILNKNRKEIKKKDSVGVSRRISVQSTRQSRRRPGAPGLKEVREECFRSATCFKSLQENVNILEVLEDLTFNQLSKNCSHKAF